MMSVPAIRSTLVRKSRSFYSVEKLKVAELVLLLDAKIRKNLIWNNLSPRYQGPFKIVRQLDHNIYQIVSELGKNKIIHASRLIRYYMRQNTSIITSFWVVECKDEIYSSSENIEDYQGTDLAHAMITFPLATSPEIRF